MGAWSTHPLGNDFAQDFVFGFYKLAKIPRGFQNGKKPLLPEHVAALVAVLPLLDRKKHFIEAYVLPWMIHETRTRITDKKLSRTVKALIADTPDEYEPDPGDPSTKQLVLNLEKHWDDIMSGKVPFDVVENDQGVFAALLSDGDKPVINRSPKKLAKKSAARKPKS